MYKIINCQYFWFLDPILNFLDKERKVLKDREKRDIQGKKHFREIRNMFRVYKEKRISERKKIYKDEYILVDGFLISNLFRRPLRDNSVVKYLIGDDLQVKSESIVHTQLQSLTWLFQRLLKYQKILNIIRIGNVHHTFLVQVYPVIYICNIIELEVKNVNFNLFTLYKNV